MTESRDRMAQNGIIQPNRFALKQTREHICVSFDTEHPVLSSAVLNGGGCTASNILIMKVAENFTGKRQAVAKPEKTLAGYCRQLQLSGTTVGMMTSASMESFRQVSRSSQGVKITAMVTAGISNARCAGDRADQRVFHEYGNPTGTINIIILTTAKMSPAALVESVMLAAEAKTVAMRELDVKSPVSRAIATGTGTDAIAVANGAGPETIRYCGKHVLFGEMLASAVIEAITTSLGNRIS
jgi:adenosylcobinamide amidohydrolase